MAKFCRECGTRMDDVSGLCPKCSTVYTGAHQPREQAPAGNGIPLAHAAPQRSSRKKSAKKLLVGIVCCFLLMIAAIAATLGTIDFFNIADIPSLSDFWGRPNSMPETDADSVVPAPKSEINQAESTATPIESNPAEKYCEQGQIYLYGLDGTEMDLAAAYTNFERARELGNTDASYYLGILCHRYNYPELDLEAAKSYYEESIDNLYAQLSLANLYYYGLGVKEDKVRAKEMIRSVVDSGCAEGYLGLAWFAYDEEDYAAAYENCRKVAEYGTEQVYVARAMNYIGLMYYNGSGRTQNYEKAVEWYKKAADLGCAEAMHNMGVVYRQGYGVEQDLGKAMEWYMKAANLGHVEDMYTIGKMYFYGNGVGQDYEKAMEWYMKAAELGNSDSMFTLGLIYASGNEVEQDYEKAMEWWMKAAELGNVYAMFNIGGLYAYGEGVEQDYGKARGWWMKAANLGNADAMCNIGVMYVYGEGVSQDYKKAMEWFVKAANLGHPSAMYNIGDMYANGYGVEQDDEKAKEWYKKSAESSASWY